MSDRVCRACQYNVVSDVVSACPNCGQALPVSLASSSPLLGLGALLTLVAAGAAWFAMREGRPALTPPVPSSLAARPASPAAVTPGRPAASPRAAASGAAGAVDDRKVAALVAQLADPQSAYAAADALAKIGGPRAEQALMAAYDRRDYARMAGAAAFYARRRPPAYEKVLLDLLEQSRDLAVAQELILSADPRLEAPARKWAAEQGFKLVRSAKTPTGVTWVAVSEPAR
jgi:hypothetical protein